MIMNSPRERSHSKRKGLQSPFHRNCTWSTELTISWRKRCLTRLMLRIVASTLGYCRRLLPSESLHLKQKRSRRSSSLDSRLMDLNRSSNKEVRLSLWNSISLIRDPDLRIRLIIALAQRLWHLNLVQSLTIAYQSKEEEMLKGPPKIHMIVV